MTIAKTASTQSTKNFVIWETRKTNSHIINNTGFISQNKFDKLVDVIAIVNTQNLSKGYIFYNVQIYVSGKMFKI